MRNMKGEIDKFLISAMYSAQIACYNEPRLEDMSMDIRRGLLEGNKPNESLFSN